jgi:hypothetical protein
MQDDFSGDYWDPDDDLFVASEPGSGCKLTFRPLLMLLRMQHSNLDKLKKQSPEEPRQKRNDSFEIYLRLTLYQFINVSEIKGILLRVKSARI